MNNRLSRNAEDGGGQPPQEMSGSEYNNEQEQSLLSVDTPPETPPEPPAEPAVPFLPAAAAAAAPASKGLLEGLFGGGRNQNNRNRRGSSNQGGLLNNLGGLDFGGIADLLRSGGGGITRILQNFSINWDAGDILMVLILIFMSLESDDDEILILLALVLVMGL